MVEYKERGHGDNLLIWWYLAGIIMGGLVITGLHLFPGTDASTTNDNPAEASHSVATAKPSPSNLSEGAPSGHNWHGVPPEELEKLRKQFKFTPAQMEKVMERSRREALGGVGTSSSSWTPHQKLNALVYVVLFGVLIHVLNRDYDQAITILFVQWFPKEAEVLGIGKASSFGD